MSTKENAAAQTATKSFSSYEELTPILKQRFAALSVFYSNQALILKILSRLEQRGTNSWKSTYDKIAAIGRSDHKQAMYEDGLYESLVVGDSYKFDDIITIIGTVRYEMGLPPYMSNLKKNCESDFTSLFMVESILQEPSTDSDQIDLAAKVKRTTIGYRPTVRLKPEEE